MKSLLARTIKLFLLMVFLLNGEVTANSNTTNAITEAYLTRDIVKLRIIQKNLSSAISYESAYLHYRLALSYMFSNSNDKAEALLDTAENILLSEQLKKDSLNYSLLASVYSLKAGLGLFSGAVYGKKSSKNIEKAEKLDINNPQVWLVKGLSAYHTPGIFGGSNKKALEYFNKAITLFSSNQDKITYWGLEETLVWRAILHHKDGRQNDAIKDLKQALVLNSNFEWAKEILSRFTSSQ
jgi:tetratricopeptide (TPR) repeat protein